MMEHETLLTTGPLWEDQGFSEPLTSSVSSRDPTSIVQTNNKVLNYTKVMNGNTWALVL